MNAIHLEDILFVFGSWTLMVKSEDCRDLKSGDRVALLGDGLQSLGEASVRKLLPSRNPAITPIEIEPIVSPDNFKAVKYFIRK